MRGPTSALLLLVLFGSPAAADEPASARSEEPTPMIEYEHRHPYWLPWTVAGSGVLLGVTGTLLMLQSNTMMDDFDRNLAMTCSSSGCSLEQVENDPRLGGLRDKAQFRSQVGTVVAITGVAALAGGLVWAFINRPTARLVMILPTSDGATAYASWSF